jgi:hypothetical protein
MESIPLQAWQALRAPLFLENSAHEGGKFVSPYAPAAFTPQEIPSVLISLTG